MAIGALQTGYNTLYGKVAGLGTQNGQTRGSSFREHIDGTEKKAPYQHLAQNGTITYKGVTFVCDTDRNRITLGDVTDRSKCLNISLKGGFAFLQHQPLRHIAPDKTNQLAVYAPLETVYYLLKDTGNYDVLPRGYQPYHDSNRGG